MTVILICISVFYTKTIFDVAVNFVSTLNKHRGGNWI